jgi:hypothetical protein
MLISHNVTFTASRVLKPRLQQAAVISHSTISALYSTMTTA